MIHAFPGMGADQRMYPPPWDRLPGFKAHAWPAHAGERSLRELAETMVRLHGIEDGDRLIGSSLGGMVAGEITRLRRIPELFLVGSAAGREEVNGLLSLLLPLAQIAPFDMMRASAGLIPHDLTRMMAGAETSFLRSMCTAISQWEGLATTANRVYRIHGAADLVILPPAKVDLLLEGGHLIAMTHARECVQFVERHLTQKGAGR